MRGLLFLVLILCTTILKGQYPFEQFSAIKYKDFDDWKIYDKSEEVKNVHATLTIPGFYDNSGSLSIQLTSFTDQWCGNSIVRVFRNKTETQKFTENIPFNPVGLDSVRVADINGDGLMDVKIVIPYMGNGTASLNVRVIYLFQRPDQSFNVISFNDKSYPNLPERDFDGDGNYEIITMNLTGYENHSYWVFNLFNYKDNGFKNVNSKLNYPIMIQYLFRENYELTNRISREKMKQFGLNFPDGYEIK